MKLKNTIFAFLLSLNFNAFAEVKDFKTELGFHKITDSKTPDFLKKASKSVFEIRIYSADTIDDIQAFNLEDTDLENKIRATDKLDKFEKIIYLGQIKRCKEKKYEVCPFYPIEKATGFLAGKNNQILWTNAHVVERFLNINAQYDNKSILEILNEKIQLPIFVFDQDGELIYDPAEKEAYVQFYDASSKGANSTRWYSFDTDFVGINLNKSIGAALEFGGKPKEGDVVYRPGYAGCTGCENAPNSTDPILNNDRGQDKNSTGQGLWWTSGEIQSTETAISFFNINLIWRALIDLQKIISFSADAQVGMSGGPILDKNGDVVGIHYASFAVEKDDMIKVLSRGVRPTYFDK